MRGRRWLRDAPPRRRPLRSVHVLLTLGIALAGCAGADPLTVPSPSQTPISAPASARPASPQGSVRVTVADVPATWVGADGDDLGADDLAAIWGLPLYRLDPAGQLRRGLAAAEQVGVEDPRGWAVEVMLRPGRWTDGSPVTADDVVATLDALAATPRAAALPSLVAVEPRGAERVRLVFDPPDPAWAMRLAGSPGILPAAVLATGGLAAYEQDIPVSGGWFRLVEHDPGRLARFEAHPDGPLGPPGLAEVTIEFAARYETALGLLDTGRTDVVLGHLALNPVARATRLDGVEAAAPLGGTWVALEWREDGRLGGPDRAADRRAVADVVGLGELVDGLLGGFGAPATSPWSGVAGPWPALPEPPDRDVGGAATLLLPRWHEAIGAAGRAVGRGASLVDLAVTVVSEETPAFVAAARADVDGVLRIRRDPPRPSLAAMLPEGPGRAAAVAADTAGAPDDPAIAAGFAAVRDHAAVRPLFRIGVAHAWRPDAVAGIAPSAWPGTGLWNVGEWRVPEGAPGR